MAAYQLPNSVLRDFHASDDCDLAGRYLSTLLFTVDNPPYEVVRDYIPAVRPDDNRTDSELHDILQVKIAGSIGASYEIYPDLKTCDRQICGHVGDVFGPGLLGYGVLAGMGVEFLLVIGYCAAALALYCRKRFGRRGTPFAADDRMGPLDRVLYAFHATSKTFMAYSSLFCLGLSVAAVAAKRDIIPRDGEYKQRNNSFGTEAMVVGSALFAVAAPIPAYLWDSRAQWLDTWALVPTWALATTALAMSAVSAHETWWVFHDLCGSEWVSPETSAKVAGFAWFGVVVPVVIAACAGIAAAFWRCSARRMWESPRARMAIKGLVLVYSVVAFVGMPTLLFVLCSFLSKASWTKAFEWDMGQCLALAIWIPLIYEIVQTAIVGIDQSLHARVPKEFAVMRVGDVGEGPAEFGKMLTKTMSESTSYAPERV